MSLGRRLEIMILEILMKSTIETPQFVLRLFRIRSQTPVAVVLQLNSFVKFNEI